MGNSLVAVKTSQQEFRFLVVRVAVTALICWAVTFATYLWLDRPAEKLVNGFGYRDLTGYLGRVGSWEFLLPILVAVGLLLIYYTRSLVPAAFLTASYVIAAIATGAIKTAAARPEPLDTIGELGRSFPSGHTAQATAVYFAFAFIAYMGDWKYKKAVLIAAIVLTSTAATCSFLRNAHWVSDLFAGIALGFTSILVSTVVYKFARVSSDFASK